MKVKTLRIGVYPFVMYLSKQSCLTNEINNKLQYIEAAGLIEKWTSEYKETRFSNSDERVPRKLNLTHLFGVFQVYGLLLGVAFVAFIIEIVRQ